MNPGTASTYDIELVASATSAAPGYFNPVKLGDGDDAAEYVDGAIQANNPSSIAWQEAWNLARLQDPSVTASQAIAGLVSIGTGKSVWNILEKSRSIPLMKYAHMYRSQSKLLTDTVSLF
jgi:Patatin-like phospholipase